mmetsp:Transcript_16246/g.50437  ORF Transcript_16246/g.50437 Transcript_16246/m.50437 type:complete len:442 (+) Transcript_16246:1390-2715(+)
MGCVGIAVVVRMVVAVQVGLVRAGGRRRAEREDFNGQVARSARGKERRHRVVELVERRARRGRLPLQQCRRRAVDVGPVGFLQDADGVLKQLHRRRVGRDGGGGEVLLGRDRRDADGGGCRGDRRVVQTHRVAAAARAQFAGPQQASREGRSFRDALPGRYPRSVDAEGGRDAALTAGVGVRSTASVHAGAAEDGGRPELAQSARSPRVPGADGERRVFQQDYGLAAAVEHDVALRGVERLHWGVPERQLLVVRVDRPGVPLPADTVEDVYRVLRGVVRQRRGGGGGRFARAARGDEALHDTFADTVAVLADRFERRRNLARVTRQAVQCEDLGRGRARFRIVPDEHFDHVGGERLRLAEPRRDALRAPQGGDGLAPFAVVERRRGGEPHLEPDDPDAELVHLGAVRRRGVGDVATENGHLLRGGVQHRAAAAREARVEVL